MGFFWILFWSLVHTCLSQSHLKLLIKKENADIIKWQTYKTKISSSHAEVSFDVCFDLSCVSTIPEGLQTDSIFFIKDDENRDAAAVDVLQTPEKSFAAVFKVKDQTEFKLSIWDIAPGILCNNIWYHKNAPTQCLSKKILVANCQGENLVCQFEAVLKAQNKPITAIMNWNRKIGCDDQSEIIELTLEDKNEKKVSVCAKKQFGSENVYEFNQMSNQEMAVYFDPFTLQLVVHANLKTHDDIEAGVFTFALIIFLIVWTEISQGGIIQKTNFVLLKNNEKILTADVTVSIFVTSCLSVAKHGIALIPNAVGLSISLLYVTVSTIIYIFALSISLITALVIVSKAKLLKTDIRRNIILRHAVEFQIMLAVHLHFPTALSILLREILGLVLAITIASIAGRDTALLAKLTKKIDKTSFFTFFFFALVLHHAAIVMTLPVVYRSSGIANSSAVIVSAALVFTTYTSSIIYTIIKNKL